MVKYLLFVGSLVHWDYVQILHSSFQCLNSISDVGEGDISSKGGQGQLLNRILPLTVYANRAWCSGSPFWWTPRGVSAVWMWSSHWYLPSSKQFTYTATKNIPANIPHWKDVESGTQSVDAHHVYSRAIWLYSGIIVEVAWCTALPQYGSLLSRAKGLLWKWGVAVHGFKLYQCAYTLNQLHLRVAVSQCKGDISGSLVT